MGTPLLQLSHLITELRTGDRVLRPVDGVSFSVDPGKTLALVGESGSGKTLAALSILRLLPPGGRIASGSVQLEGLELATLPERKLRDIRGSRIGTVFQEPLTALNPVLSVGEQVAETVRAHRRVSRADARRRAVELLAQVRLPDPEWQARAYPHQLSGGMRQRVGIAIAIACGPALVIADEPTSALDSSVQAQILALLRELQQSSGMGLLFISHDLGVVRSFCDDIAVMYAGRIVEQGSARTVFASPAHPYTAALLACRPGPEVARRSLLPALPGAVPALDSLPSGCRFRDRCPRASARCEREDPLLTAQPAGQLAACHHPLPGAAT